MKDERRRKKKDGYNVVFSLIFAGKLFCSKTHMGGSVSEHIVMLFTSLHSWVWEQVGGG